MEKESKELTTISRLQEEVEGVVIDTGKKRESKEEHNRADVKVFSGDGAVEATSRGTEQTNSKDYRPKIDSHSSDQNSPGKNNRKSQVSTLDVDEEVRGIIDHTQEPGTVAEEQEPNTMNINRSNIDDVVEERHLVQHPGSQFSSGTATYGPDLDTKLSKISMETNSDHRQSLDKHEEPNAVSSPTASRATSLNPKIHRNSLPPEPEPEVRFNFHLFLEQLRHRTADPVARYLRSFLFEFGKKQWTVQEQVRIISDFLVFIGGKMAQCEIWRNVSDAEFDNAREGMEKLVMNRLYAQTFSPELPLSAMSASNSRGRQKPQKQAAIGRRGQHQEDVERDNVLSEKMQIFGWVEEQHLDIKPVNSDGKRFLTLAQQELLKINNYRAPRDKVICILNACKVIFGLLRSSQNNDTSADSFMPFLIYTVLRARPRHMVSNIQYIFRFRNQDKLAGEAGYYLSSLMGAVQFVENLDKTALTISEEEFEKHVEASVAAITERQPDPGPPRDDAPNALLEPRASSMQSASQSPSRASTGEEGPVQGILRNIQRPLTNLGRIFSDESANIESYESSRQKTSTGSQENSEQQASTQSHERRGDHQSQDHQGPPSNVDIENIVATLSAMFPSLDRDVISDIVIAKQARIGAAVDACLSLNT